MNVLLLTHSGDFFTIDRVQKALKDIGMHPIRVNTDLFPQEVKINFQLTQGSLQVLLDNGVEVIDLDTVEGVWMRRIWTPKIDEAIGEDFHKIAVGESATILRNTLDFLKKAVWVDPLDKINIARNKLYQLKTALQYGLTIPETLVTNSAKAATDFYNQYQNIITKMAKQTAYSMKRTAMSMHTYKVEPEHVEDFDGLQYCPMIFQTEIPKECELRVVYVAGEFYVGAIDTSDSELGKTDWRQAAVDSQYPWENYQLPDDLKQKITGFMNHLDLEFGALDIIKTPANGYVFLEVNPTGEWGMLERDLDLPISQAIANTLYQKIKSRSENFKK